MGLFKGAAPDSEILDAVRNATPESRRAFEERFGPAAGMEACVICPELDGGWVETYTLREDGTVEKVRHEGDSEEAERLRAEVRQGHAGRS